MSFLPPEYCETNVAIYWFEAAFLCVSKAFSDVMRAGLSNNARVLCNITETGPGRQFLQVLSGSVLGFNTVAGSPHSCKVTGQKSAGECGF